jgi:hypothetical protein
VLVKPTVQMARIKKAKILEKRLFIKVIWTLDVKITFSVHGIWHCCPGRSAAGFARIRSERKETSRPASIPDASGRIPANHPRESVETHSVSEIGLVIPSRVHVRRLRVGMAGHAFTKKRFRVRQSKRRLHDYAKVLSDLR